MENTQKKINIAVPNFENIPTALQDRGNFVLWAGYRQDDRISKIPLQPTLKNASATDRRTWSSYKVARDAFLTAAGKEITLLVDHCPVNCKVLGIGTVLNGDGLVGIDFDHCILPDGTLAPKTNPKIAELINRLTAITHTEISPSKTGIRAFLYGRKQSKKCRTKSIEIYDDKRFMTITGHTFGNSPSEISDSTEAQEVLDNLMMLITHKGESLGKGSIEGDLEHQSVSADEVEDETILERARNAKNGDKFCKLFDEGDIGDYPSHSEADFALANILAFYVGENPEQIDGLMRKSALLQDKDRLEKWDSENRVGGLTYGEATIEKAIENLAENQSQFEQAQKVKIIFEPHKISNNVIQMAAALKGDIFQSDNMLVRLVKVPVGRAFHLDIHNKHKLQIFPLTPSGVVYLASKRIKFYKYKERGNVAYPNPIVIPPILINAFLESRENINVLNGITTIPVLRADGSIISELGYDSITGLYADFDPATYPPLPENPTRQDAEEALSVLMDSIGDFPYVSDVDKAVALAAILTCVIRPSLRNAPFFAISAPTPGTGKSALADCICIIITGRAGTPIDYNRDPVEFKKTIFSALLAGGQVYLIDNVVGVFNSSFFNILLSQETVSERVLGVSKNAELGTQGLFIATGNNLQVSADMIRRTMLCSLDAKMEKPTERQFRRPNIYKWIENHRNELVIAALTILKAYQSANFPDADQIKRMNGYAEWSKWVRGSLLWLGCGDPLKSQETMEAEDPVKEAFERILIAWYDKYGNKAVPTELVIAETTGHLDQAGMSNEEKNLASALRDGVYSPHGLTPKSLGKWLGHRVNQIAGGLKLVKAGVKKKVAEWQVVEVSNDDHVGA